MTDRFTTEDLQKATRIYLGADRACRCGCTGTYAEAGTPLFTARLKNMMNKVEAGAKLEDDGSLLNVSFGNNRAYTLYFG